MVQKSQADQRQKLREAFNEFGGNLTFRFTSSHEGWLAECNEIPGIFTGTPNPAPTFAEIDALIRDAIFAAFDVVPSEAPQLKRTVHANLEKLSVSITKPILTENEYVAVLGRAPGMAYA